MTRAAGSEGASASSEEPRGTVVLLHGLGRSALAMWPMASALRRAGWLTENLGYAGLRRAVPDTAARMAERLDELRREREGPLHLVTHSLGGILARAWLARGAPAGTRLIQLAPPNQGAQLADRMRGVLPARAIFGRTLDDLLPGLPALSLSPLAGVEVGVIAGGRGGPAGYLPWLPEDNDGVVQVKETWLPEARDWILVPHVHSFIMNAGGVHRNVAAFLEGGRFLEDATRLARGEDGRVGVRG